jgi:hypothetical protein
MVPNFLSVTWCGEAFHGLGVQDVKTLILVDALFPLSGERKRGRKKKGKEKKLLLRKGVFPWLDPPGCVVDCSY